MVQMPETAAMLAAATANVNSSDRILSVYNSASTWLAARTESPVLIFRLVRSLATQRPKLKLAVSRIQPI